MGTTIPLPAASGIYGEFAAVCRTITWDRWDSRFACAAASTPFHERTYSLRMNTARIATLVLSRFLAESYPYLPLRPRQSPVAILRIIHQLCHYDLPI